MIGMIERGSMLGKMYEKNKNDSVFYKQAVFYSADEVASIMKKSGFSNFVFRQTLFSKLSAITENEAVKEGYGDGLFTVICGRKR